jgi:protein-tyrosine phosphatase
MAEGLLRQRLAERGLSERHQVLSAGVWALDERPASENAILVMAERGIDIASHRAHTISSTDVSEAELILVMSREHARSIRATWPQYDWKVHRLSEMAGKKQDVRDPYGGPISDYRRAADVIANYIDHGLERILQLV